MVKYDAQTLLALSQNARIDLTRFSDQAFGNNLLRSHKASTGVLAQHPVNRSRNVSSFSRQSETTLTTSESNLQFPVRQPHDPPPEIGAQFDAGFAQFLKEHTSPRHQRVTAGGRIVPMNPPKWNLPTTKHAPNANATSTNTRKPPSRNESKPRPDDHPVQENSLDNKPLSNITSLPRGDATNSRHLPLISGNIQHQFSNPPSFQSTASSSSTLSLSNSSLTTNYHHPPQEPQSQEYLPPTQQDYPAEGVVWYPNPIQAVNLHDSTFAAMPSTAQPYPVPQAASDFSSCTGANVGLPAPLDQFQQGYESSSSGIGSQWPQLVNPQMPTNNQQYIPPYVQESLYQKSLDDTKRRHDALATQLGRLDRYMALHSWNIDPNTKRGLVEQRMNLVRELDTLRIYKEHLHFLFGKVRVSVPIPEKDAMAFPAPPPIYVNGPTAGEPTLLGPGSAVPGFNGASSMFSIPPQVNTTQPLFSTGEESYSTAPWQNIDNPAQHNNGIWTGNVPTVQGLTKAPSLSEQEATRVLNTRSEVHLPPKRYVSNKTEDAVSANGGLETPTRSAPTEIRKLYRQIEEATRQGTSIQHLIEELSIVTTRLSKKERGEATQTLHIPSVVPETQGPSASVRVKVPVTKIGSNNTTRYPVQHSRRLWQSDDYPHKFKSYRRVTPIQANEEDDRRSCASYLSTTDSWVTTQEGEARWLDQELRNCAVSQEKNWPSWTNDTPGQRTGLAGTQASSLRNTTFSNIPIEPTPILPTLDGSLSREPVWQGSRTPYPPLLTQCFSRDRSPALQKTTALAVPQNVNAHAFLPHVDGAADAPFLNSTTLIERGDIKSQSAEQKEKRWRMSKKSVKPAMPVTQK